MAVAKAGSEFCDTCTTVRNDIQCLDPMDERYSYLSQCLDTHRDNAERKHDHYRLWITSNFDVKDVSAQHLVFDFAEKVLLPHLLRQSGQLYFIAGLKFDIFGIHNSNQGVTFLYGLPKGHWMNEKRQTLSSLCCIIVSIERRNHYTIHRTLEDCYFMQIIAQDRTRTGSFSCILFGGLSLGLSKRSVCVLWLPDTLKIFVDGAFGHVKRLLKLHDARTPLEMRNIISVSSATTQCVPSVDVHWLLCKYFLDEFFKIPSAFQITKYHQFRFDASTPGKSFAKWFSLSGDEREFYIVKKYVTF